MKKKSLFISLILLLIANMLVFAGCNKQNSDAELNKSENEVSNKVEEETGDMKLTIGGTEVPVTWEDNKSVEALKQLGDIEIQMSMYGGNEQVGPIGQTLPSADAQTTTKAGDIVLYSSNQIVVFYGSNTWAYTRLGHIDLSEDEMTELLGNGDVALKITH